jgi:hypothetical protein
MDSQLSNSKNSEINESLNGVMESFSVVEKLVEILGDRLTPILKPESPRLEEESIRDMRDRGSPVHAKCEVATAIDDFSGQAKRASRNLQSIIDRLAV